MEAGVLDTLGDVRKDKIGRLVNQALATAYLLTGSGERAEASVEAGMGSWDPDDQPERLLQSVAAAAVKYVETDVDDWRLSSELQSVMSLSREPRRSFVLRVLLGLPPQVCARLLRVNVEELKENVLSALQQLPLLRKLNPQE
jgi:DNA-directed RNA polymerase specialized sigma24 family protein